MNLKEFLKTPKGKLTAALAALAVSWLFLFLYFVGPLDNIAPTAKEIANQENEVKKLRKENAALKEELARLQKENLKLQSDAPQDV